MENRQRRLFVQNVLKLKSKGKSKLEADLQQEFLQEKRSDPPNPEDPVSGPVSCTFLAPTPQVFTSYYHSCCACHDVFFSALLVRRTKKKNSINQGQVSRGFKTQTRFFCINMRTVVASAGQFSLFRILLACEGSMSGHHRRLVHAQN